MVKDLFSQILQYFNAQTCKIHIVNTVSFLKNIALNLVLDHEKCTLSNAVDVFLQYCEYTNTLQIQFF